MVLYPRFRAVAAACTFAAAVLVHTAAAADASATTATPATAAGASTTLSGTILVTGTSLPEIVQETEPCALLCYDAACVDSSCDAGDFACVCGNPNSLVVKLGICTGSDCDGQRQFDSGQWLANLCSVYSAKPPPADVTRASALLVSEIQAASATATDNPVPASASADETSHAATATAATGTAAATTTTVTSSASSGRWAPLAGLLSGAVAAVAGGLVFL